MKTIIVARLNYQTTSQTLKAAAEEFGEVVDAVIVRTPDGSSRGYGFVQFARSADMDAAYRYMDGKIIDDRAVVVDVERGRTVSNWLPRFLGGGRGSTRAGPKAISYLGPGREPAAGVFAPGSSFGRGGRGRGGRGGGRGRGGRSGGRIGGGFRSVRR